MTKYNWTIKPTVFRRCRDQVKIPNNAMRWLRDFQIRFSVSDLVRVKIFINFPRLPGIVVTWWLWSYTSCRFIWTKLRTKPFTTTKFPTIDMPKFLANNFFYISYFFTFFRSSYYYLFCLVSNYQNSNITFIATIKLQNPSYQLRSIKIQLSPLV